MFVLPAELCFAGAPEHIGDFDVGISSPDQSLPWMNERAGRPYAARMQAFNAASVTAFVVPAPRILGEFVLPLSRIKRSVHAVLVH